MDIEVLFTSSAVKLLKQRIALNIYHYDIAVKSKYGFKQDAAELGVKFYDCGGVMDGKWELISY